MIVAVCHGSGYDDYGAIRHVLESLRPVPTLVLHDGSMLAQRAADSLGVQHAGWRQDRRKPDLLLAFPDAAAEVIKTAREAKIKVLYPGTIR